MHTVYLDPDVTDETRREQLYDGQLFVYSATPSSLKLVELARELIREAFGSHDPETAQDHMPVEQYAQLLADLKPKFIHHPDAKALIPAILKEVGCDLAKTYFDVPRMRTATSDDYLTTGIAYAFHPHRDTWYSAPLCQLNWWLPIYSLESGRSMAFHPRYWRRPVRNGLHSYNYTEWNKTSRFNAAQHLKSDNRVQPRPEEPMELDPQLRVITPVGGLLIFSGAQMHSTVPNQTGRTRFSIDFRTVNLDDVEGFRGAPNVDSACTGTSMGDFLRGTDLAHLPSELVASYEPGPAGPGQPAVGLHRVAGIAARVIQPTPMANPEAPFQDRVAIVTGASRGIGKAIALTLAAHHATVCLVGRCRDTLQEVARTANSSSMHVIQTDLTDDDALRSLSRFIEREFQRADILVHSAGLYGHGALADTSIDQFDLLHRMNVRAPYLLTQLLLPLLVASTGQVVFVNSSQGLNAAANVGQFGATQHALKAIADSLRAEINQDGVRVLSVYPGRTATPRIEDLYLSEQKTYQPELLLQPADIASVVVNALGLPRTAEVTNISIRPFVKSY